MHDNTSAPDLLTYGPDGLPTPETATCALIFGHQVACYSSNGNIHHILSEEELQLIAQRRKQAEPESEKAANESNKPAILSYAIVQNITYDDE